MKVCINCYTENPDDAVSCSECGMSLKEAPTGEEAMKLKELAAKPEAEGRPQPKQPRSMFSIWVRAVTRPVLATYEKLLREELNPTLGKAVGWIAIGGVIAGAISGLLSLLLSLLFGTAQGQSAGDLLMYWVFSLISVPVGEAIYFMILSAISLAIARAFGGEGNLGSQSYLLAAAQAPMSIISGALGAVPLAGIVIACPARIYLIYLEVVAMRAVHRFGWGKAVGAILIPVSVLGALYCIYVFFIFAMVIA